MTRPIASVEAAYFLWWARVHNRLGFFCVRVSSWWNRLGWRHRQVAERHVARAREALRSYEGGE